MGVEDLVAAVMGRVPNSLVAGVVDLQTGMMLSVNAAEQHPPQVMDLLAATVGDLFAGDNMATLSEYFGEVRGTDNAQLGEALLLAGDLIYVSGRLASNPDMLVVALVEANSPLGMVLVKFRQVLATAEVSTD